MIVTSRLALSLLAGLGLISRSHAEESAASVPPPLFYRAKDYGSESQFNPMTSFVNYSLDTLQVPASFGDEDLGSGIDATWAALRHPVRSIDEEGGWKAFINRQVFPIERNHLDESVAMIPNYALHLFGGGMVFRKNVEWFQAHRYRRPRTYAVVLGMASEFLQEAIEKKSTTADDPVADFYIFRPVGMMLFSWERFARFSADRLRLVEWPYQPMYGIGKSDFTNVGENFAIRPSRHKSEGRTTPFLYFGLTTLLGASHKMNMTDRLSWGVGEAAVEARRNNVDLRPSAGVFYDRDGSLLGSLIVNGTDGLAGRLNVYPGVLLHGKWSPGVYLGIADGAVALGFSVRVTPVGISDHVN